MDAGVLWSYMVEEARVPTGNHGPWSGDQYAAKWRCRESISGRGGGKQVFYPCAIQGLI